MLAADAVLDAPEPWEPPDPVPILGVLVSASGYAHAPPMSIRLVLSP